MTYSAPLPYFVYGTLRRGFDNYRWHLAEETINEVPAVLDSAAMYAGPGYPQVVFPSPGNKVVGTLMYIDDQRLDDVLRSLDRLEGFEGEGKNNHHERIAVNVTAALGETVRAHTYVLPQSRADTMTQSGRIPTGDWVLHNN